MYKKMASSLITRTEATNCCSYSSRPEYIVAIVKKLLNQGSKIAVFVLISVPNKNIIDLLGQAGFIISLYDPHLMKQYRTKDLKLITSETDMILILSDHPEIRDLDYEVLAKEMRTPQILDTLGFIDVKNPLFSEFNIYNLANIALYCNL